MFKKHVILSSICHRFGVSLYLHLEKGRQNVEFARQNVGSETETFEGVDIKDGNLMFLC